MVAAGLGGLLLGYNSSNIAVALPVRPFRRHGAVGIVSFAKLRIMGCVRNASADAPLSLTQLLEVAFASVAESNVLKEAIVSITTLGSAVGGFFGGFASDYFGRRVSIMPCSVGRACPAAPAIQPNYLPSLFCSPFLLPGDPSLSRPTVFS